MTMKRTRMLLLLALLAITPYPAEARAASLGPQGKRAPGRIIFSSSPASGPGEAGEGKASFSAGDDVYGIVLLATTLKDSISYLPSRELLTTFTYRLFVDGEEVFKYGGFPGRITWEQYQDPAST